MKLLLAVAFVADTGDPYKRRGLFGKTHISIGEMIRLNDGPWQLLSKDAVGELPEHFRRLCCDYEFDDGYEVCPADFQSPALSFFINHSCDPNVASADNWETMIVLRNIEAGEELTCDYGTVNARKEGFTCACGASNCRKVVTGNDWIRPELQERYRGYFQKNIQEKIDGLNSEQHERSS